MTNIQQVVAIGLDTEQVLELAGGNDNARGGNKPGYHRMAQEIGQEAQPQHPHQGEHQARHHRQQNSSGQILSSARLGQWRQSSRRHQRGHRHRANREGATGSEHRIDHQWQDAGVQPDLRREARQQSVGQRLWNQHNGDNHRSHQITGGLVTTVGWRPLQNGQIAFQIHARLRTG